jgi:hypothetical protein
MLGVFQNSYLDASVMTVLKSLQTLMQVQVTGEFEPAVSEPLLGEQSQVQP